MNTESLAIIETLNSGGDIAKLMSSMASNPVSFPKAVGTLLSAFIACRGMVTLAPSGDNDLDQFLNAGIATMTLAFNQHLAVPDNEWMSKYVSAVCRILTACQPLGMNLKINGPVTQPAPPTPVAVMSLPSRETLTKVAYDAKGNIASTSQTEKDA